MKIKVLTLPNFLAWAKTKPKKKTFEYNSPENCAIAQFLNANGFAEVNVEGYQVNGVCLPESIIKRVGLLLDKPGTVFTFGDLVTALEAPHARKIPPNTSQL